MDEVEDSDVCMPTDSVIYQLTERHFIVALTVWVVKPNVFQVIIFS
jgi:hypothetical protein